MHGKQIRKLFSDSPHGFYTNTFIIRGTTKEETRAKSG